MTSDVDIVVRHVPPAGEWVLLTFQATPLMGGPTSGVLVPMLLGETAYLTLPRNDYLIGALVLDPGREHTDRSADHRDHGADDGAPQAARTAAARRHRPVPARAAEAGRRSAAAAPGLTPP
ncbi:hypothetical protein ABJI51_06730 [Amycolatopsis sp. NEAU-NG30]|uniref:Uncharacterized protein n=1 Tax=Amycolatopsis melonis TaxID=3156488 RepID=A0ABV0LBN1_9PSEU